MTDLCTQRGGRHRRDVVQITSPTSLPDMGAQRVLVVVAEAGGSSRVARVWRDEGHEVVLVGPGTVAAGVAAAAVQEDVDLVVLVAGGESGAEDGAEDRATEYMAAEVRRLLASSGAEDVEVVTASDPRPDLP